MNISNEKEKECQILAMNRQVEDWSANNIVCEFDRK